MAIAFGAAGTADSSATRTVAPTYPAVSAGDYLFLQVSMKYSDPTVATPSGWTALGNTTGGAGTDGTVDEGNVRTYLFGKEATGSESGTLSISNSGGTASCLAARIISLTKGASEAWNVSAGVTASDNTAGTSIAFAYGSDPGITANDWLVTVWAINSDAYTHTHALTCSGLSSITTQSRGNVAVTAGANMRYGFVTHAIGAGTASGNATYTNTASGSATNAPAGASVMVRVRVTSTGSDTPMDAAVGTFTLTGQAATFDISMTAEAGTFTLTGNAASLETSSGGGYLPRFDKRRRSTAVAHYLMTQHANRREVT